MDALGFFVDQKMVAVCSLGSERRKRNLIFPSVPRPVRLWWFAQSGTVSKMKGFFTPLNDDIAPLNNLEQRSTILSLFYFHCLKQGPRHTLGSQRTFYTTQVDLVFLISCLCLPRP